MPVINTSFCRVERLEAEAKAAAEKFEEVNILVILYSQLSNKFLWFSILSTLIQITKKWDYALSKEVPQDLFAVSEKLLWLIMTPKLSLSFNVCV